MKRPRSAPARTSAPRALVTLVGGAGLAALAYGGYAATTWVRYGRHAARPDPLLDRFLPDYEVAERHQVAVAAPVGDTMAAVRALDFGRLPVAGLLFRVRGLLLGAGEPEAQPTLPRGMAEQTLAMGWGVLADRPDVLVMGAVCQPWEADPGFRPVPPEDFSAFAEPGLVKIVWAVGAAPTGPAASVAWTATRVATTDAGARARFRPYWAALSPGIRLIRWESLRLVRTEAERLHREEPRALRPRPLVGPSAPAAPR